jgi:adenylate kinase
MSDRAIEQGPRLVLLGKQGAGKGTQAELLADRYGVEHLSTGDLFRAAAAEGTAGGLEAKRYMDAGELVPDDTVIKVVDDRFTGDFLDRGFILDGFPRTLPQAKELEKVLTPHHPLDLVISLEVSTEIVLDRIAGRRVCENGDATYHVNSPPKHNWTCDKCGGRVVQRDDDTEEAIHRRLELYEEETEPIIDFYDKLGKLARVDAVGDGDEVFERLVKEIDRHYPRAR